ncbi:hypothetical protein QEZ47_10170 [Aminobacter anthyllidis]|uniref:hypothetical protein n=1 Tax=Aminobacter anthyllidis TaxID=1035067 RepID=UPI002456D3F2|nr:hypothetical protein [Aminobacter anthyllidis]MDH4985895.1 hypothetical protein [Aminobacter anthyllidis]
MADVDRRAVFLQRQNDDLDRAVDTCAKAARLAEPDRQGRFGQRLEHLTRFFIQCRNDVCAPLLSRETTAQRALLGAQMTL